MIAAAVYGSSILLLARSRACDQTFDVVHHFFFPSMNSIDFTFFPDHWGRHLLETSDNPWTAMGNCTPPAIEEFPRPLIPQYARARGGLIIHLSIAVYMFLGLSIVCDDYFVPALERMVECKFVIKSEPSKKYSNPLQLQTVEGKPHRLPTLPVSIDLSDGRRRYSQSFLFPSIT